MPAHLLRLALNDLALPDELRELGTAIFLDRPLGAAKAAADPDRTLLFSLEAFSRTIAGKRLDAILDKGDGMVAADDVAEWRRRLRDLEVKGIDLPLAPGGAGPGKVSLDDVRKVAHDFVFTRTSRRSVEEFVTGFDIEGLPHSAHSIS